MTRPRPQARAAPAVAVRCAIYTRKSTEDGLEQEFNSLVIGTEIDRLFGGKPVR